MIDGTEANLRATAILDFHAESVQDARRKVRSVAAPPLDYLQEAHRYLCREVSPIYTVDELQPASLTLHKRRGSCSQRFACLEALARAQGIPTRVRGLWIAGHFWAPRFRWSRHFIPRRILLAWPQFCVGEKWVGVERLFGPLSSLAEQAQHGFTNDREPIFDAIGTTAIDFDGHTAHCAGGRCDLSRFTEGDAGVYPTRDELFSSLPLFQRSLRGKAFERLYGGRCSSGQKPPSYHQG